MTRSRFVLPVATVALLLAVAIPALAAPPAGSPGAGHARGPKESKAPGIEVTLSGTVRSATDAEGKTSYTMASGGTTWTLEAGPAWFFGDAHPLKPFVGTSVTVVGEHAEGSTEVDVRSVNGTQLRAAGKPPWAGGWKQVGVKHPAWSQAKADRFKARFGDCFPPGQCKDKNREAPAATTAP